MSPMILAVPLTALQVPPVLPIDLTAVVATVMGLLVVLIPVAGLTARFALKPIVEAMARYRETQGSNRELELAVQRLSLLEQQMGLLETDVRQLEEGEEFRRELKASTDS